MNTRAVISFLVAPLFPAAMLGLLTPITGGVINTDPVSILGLMPVGYFFSAVATALLGVPAFLLLKHFDLVRWWSAIASGLVIGALVAIAIRLPSVVQARDLLVMVPIGGASALIFWLIWRPRHAA
jgi:hypothetical protein